MEMPPNKRLFVLLLLVVARGLPPECAAGESVTFEKWSGVAARGEPVFVWAAGAAGSSLGGTGVSLGGACTSRCRELPRCAAVAVSHGAARCTGYAHARRRTLTPDGDADLYVKICMRLPVACQARWWAVETTAGYHLHASGAHRLLANVTSQDCSRALVDPTGPAEYRSAQWVAAGGAGVGTLGADDAGVGTLSADDAAVGACALHAEDRATEPESYRVANFHTLYKENQCRHDFPAKIERCSYEEYYNQTLKHVELSLAGLSKDECKTSCEREVRFVCRGFSWRSLGTERDGEPGTCALHSEDILTLGSWLLRRAPGTSYYRRVVCLNISVECSEDEMVVTYRPRGLFRGRVYVPGHGEECGAGARGGRVRLELPLRGPCDVNFAYAVSNGALGTQNRTMAYAMVMIQNNPIIQTAGDRWVRVGCAPGGTGARAPHTLDAALTVSVDTVKATAAAGGAAAGAGGAAAGAVPASAVFNTSGAPPPLTMYVVRGAEGAAGAAGAEPRGAVSLGEILELRVETTDESEIEAYHLVASSRLGDSSVLLLDNRGCPTGQVDFPGFTRSWAGGGGGGGGGGALQRLSARFKAFRFPNSHVVRFALMVRFCGPRCPQVECGPVPGLQSRSARGAGEDIAGDVADDEDIRVADDAADDENLAGDTTPADGENLADEENLADDATAADDAAAIAPGTDWLATNELESGERAVVREEAASARWDLPQQDAPRVGTGTHNSAQDISAGVVVAQSGAGAGCGASAPDRVPLELELMVGSRDLLTADTLVRAEHQPRGGAEGMVGVGSESAAHALVCMHELLVVALVLAWLAVQLLLLVGCCVVVKRYRNFAEIASQKDYQPFDNVGFDTLSTHRRVHWPDQNVDILHVN